MAFIEQLMQRLKAAGDDTRAQAAVAAEFLLMAQPEPEREPLLSAADAAAVLRWFDVPLLAHLLEIGYAEARERFDTLAGFPFVERFPSRAGDAWNVDNATRLGWRRRLAAKHPRSWRALSARAAAIFDQDASPAGRIEWIYHLLSADSDHGAVALEDLNREWASNARPEDYQALTLTLGELEESALVSGKVRVEVLICIAKSNSSRGETARLAAAAHTAHTALGLARSIDHQPGLARAYCLSADVYEAQGKLEAAEAAYGEYLAISRRLAETHPSNAGWQHDLAVAHSKVGGIYEAQGKLEAAEAAYGEYLAISRRLAETHPSNAGWQHDLAVTHSKVGGIYEAQGKLEAAEAAYGEYLAISRRLAETHPSNAGWQHDLAVAHSRVGGVHEAQGKLVAARRAYEEVLSISRRLAETHPSNTGWQRDLAVAHSRVGDVLTTQGKLEGAQTAYENYLVISRRLADADPSNVAWQHQLAVALMRIGDLRQTEGKLDSALSSFDGALKIGLELARQDPGNTFLRRHLAGMHLQLGGLYAALGRGEQAEEHRRQASTIRQHAAMQQPASFAIHPGDALELLDNQPGDSAPTTLEVPTNAGRLDPARASRLEIDTDNVAPPSPAQFFICYSSKDYKWRTELESTLTILQDRGIISVWYDRMVSAGDDWDEEIQKKLDESEIILFLISRYFLASRYIKRRELPKALARHSAGKARLIPLVLTVCSWDKTPLYALQTATGDRRPIRGWKDKAEAYYKIELELEKVWRELRGQPNALPYSTQ
jgi:tetratricopeptide (TPR) repeat protein